MKPLPVEARTQNGGRNPRQFCDWCADTGYVVVALRTPDTFTWRGSTIHPSPEGGLIDEMAPCPQCMRGYCEEFPTPAAGRQDTAITAPWGTDGYWHDKTDRDVAELVKFGRALPLPKHENARRMRELAGQVAKIGRNMPERFKCSFGCGQTFTQLAALERHLATAHASAPLAEGEPR